MKKSFRELVREIVNAVQEEVAKIPDFDYGAIHLKFVPKCEIANKWMGSFGLDCERDFVFPVRPDGSSHTRPRMRLYNIIYRERDCAGMAVQKIQGCAHAYKHGMGKYSDSISDEGVVKGRIYEPGCIVFPITYATEPPKIEADVSPFMRLYVSVDGALHYERHNRICAAAALETLLRWCEEEYQSSGFELYM